MNNKPLETICILFAKDASASETEKIISEYRLEAVFPDDKDSDYSRMYVLEVPADQPAEELCETIRKTGGNYLEFVDIASPRFLQKNQFLSDAYIVFNPGIARETVEAIVHEYGLQPLHRGGADKDLSRFYYKPNAGQDLCDKVLEKYSSVCGAYTKPEDEVP